MIQTRVCCMGNLHSNYQAKSHIYQQIKICNLEYAHCIRCFYGAQKSPPEMSGSFVGKIKYSKYIRLQTGNKNPVHGRKLCTLFTATFQCTKMEKPALKTVISKTITLKIYTVTKKCFNSFDRLRGLWITVSAE